MYPYDYSFSDLPELAPEQIEKPSSGSQHLSGRKSTDHLNCYHKDVVYDESKQVQKYMKKRIKVFKNDLSFLNKLTNKKQKILKR